MFSFLTVVVAATAMAEAYRDSGDLLDLRGAFFFTVILFHAIPALVIDLSLIGSGYYFVSDFIPNLVVAQPAMQQASLIMLLGTCAVAAPALSRRGGRSVVEQAEPIPSRSIWLAYGATAALALAVAMTQYGSPLQMALYAVTPELRTTASNAMPGLSNLAFFFSAIASYYAAKRLPFRAARLALFIPALILIAPAANRGNILSLGIIAAATAFSLRPRRPFLWVLGFALLLPLAASLMFRVFRYAIFADAGGWSVPELYMAFANEAVMIPTFAYALGALRTGLIDYSWGMDLLLLPFWFVPRVVWASKPQLLDWRLNEALALNHGDIFPTPVSIFGGLWFNFTPLGYIPACIMFGVLLSWVYRRVQDDRVMKLLLVTVVVYLTRVGDFVPELVVAVLGTSAILLIRATTVPGARLRRAPTV